MGARSHGLSPYAIARSCKLQRFSCSKAGALHAASRNIPDNGHVKLCADGKPWRQSTAPEACIPKHPCVQCITAADFDMGQAVDGQPWMWLRKTDLQRFSSHNTHGGSHTIASLHPLCPPKTATTDQASTASPSCNRLAPYGVCLVSPCMLACAMSTKSLSPKQILAHEICLPHGPATTVHPPQTLICMQPVPQATTQPTSIMSVSIFLRVNLSDLPSAGVLHTHLGLTLKVVSGIASHFIPGQASFEA